MFDIGWTEMLVVAAVAIIVVGPKDLPGMLRNLGSAIKKVRALAGDFQRQFDDALKDAELDGVKNSFENIKNLDPTKQIKDRLNPLKSDIEGSKKSNDDADDDMMALFDIDKDPVVQGPVEIDVEAALARQQEIDAAKAAPPPSSGHNAVPGFGGEPAPSKIETPTKPKSASKPATGKKTAAKKPASKKSTASKSKTAASTKSKSTKTAAMSKAPAKAKSAPSKSASAKSASSKAAEAKAKVDRKTSSPSKFRARKPASKKAEA